MSLNLFLEGLATLSSLIFLVGIIQRKVWAWPYGILSSAVSVGLFWRVGLYAESGLNLVYVVLGFYGWYQWMMPRKTENLALVDLPWIQQAYNLLGIPAAILLALWIKRIPGVSLALFDSFTSVFAILATYQETRRIRTAFHYWIPINAASVVLYSYKGLWMYAALMLIYTAMSVVGYIKWRK